MSETINFSEPPDRWGTVGESRRRTGIHGIHPRVLRNCAELFTDLSPALLLLYFREMKSDGKYREGVRGEKKIHREEEAKFRRDVGPRETTFAT